MKFFFDTEFIELGSSEPIQLVSIAVVSEYGAEYYAVSNQFEAGRASDWVKENVFPFLGDQPRLVNKEIAESVLKFIKHNCTLPPEFWGYYADYDWVVFCQLFGSMIDLPKGWPMYCRDLKQWCDQLGNPQLAKQESAEHNALNDARWNRKIHGFLEAREVVIYGRKIQVAPQKKL